MTQEIIEPEPIQISPKLSSARIRYAEFLAANPSSEILVFEHEGEERLLISRPWGDRSLALTIPTDDAKLVSSLNALYLPPRYTAIYHTQDRALEVIWTAYKLDGDQSDLIGRSFELRLPDAEYNCDFTDSSDCLLEIARQAIPIEISSTGFRNLQSFGSLLNKEKKESDDDDLDPYGKALSFWVKNVDWDDENVANIVRHINFYLKYYDSKSPVIEIHPIGDAKIAPKNRYFEDFSFPKEIISPNLDTKLLIMYSSGFNSSAISTSFLNLYRVIEYVSLDWTYEQAKKELRYIISKPHALHDIDRTSTELMLILREMKAEREQEALPRFLKEVVKPERLWREIEPNQNLFSAATEFEGGLKISPIATEKTTSETFGPAGIEAFARACSKIRNGLAHGRDKVSADSILPTSRNFDLLRPWVNALTACAGEVVLYAGRH